MVQCEYHDVGCEVKMCRKRKREHEEEYMKDHLQMTKQKLATTKDELELTDDRLNSLEVVMQRFLNQQSYGGRYQQEPSWFMKLAAAEVTTGTPTCPCIIKVPDFDKILSQNSDKMFCSEFYTKSKGYLIQLCVDVADPVDEPKAKNLLVQLCLLEGPHDNELTWPMREDIEVILLNQITDDLHPLQTFSFEIV